MKRYKNPDLHNITIVNFKGWDKPELTTAPNKNLNNDKLIEIDIKHNRKQELKSRIVI